MSCFKLVLTAGLFLFLVTPAKARKPECRYTGHVWFWTECAKGQPCRLQLGFQVFAYNYTKKNITLVEHCIVKGPNRVQKIISGSYTLAPQQNMLGGLIITWNRYRTAKTKQKWRYSCTCHTKSGRLLSTKSGTVWSRNIPTR